MANKSHFKLHQPVKIDGVDFETGVYPIDEIDSGRQGSIVNAGWGEYCDAPKSKVKSKTDDDDVDLDADPDLDDEENTGEPKTDAVKTADKPPAKPARSRARK